MGTRITDIREIEDLPVTSMGSGVSLVEEDGIEYGVHGGSCGCGATEAYPCTHIEATQAADIGASRPDRGALALSTHRVIVVSWPAAGKPPSIDEPLVVLVSCEPGQHTRTRRRLSYAASVPPSAEVVEEEVVQEAVREGICFERVEERLREIYSESRAA